MNVVLGTSAADLKTVLITGVSRGLGKALALELAKRGHSVIGCARSADKLSSVKSELVEASENKSNSDKHLIMNVDVRSNLSVEELARTVVEKMVIPDIIVNNAGTINRNNKLWEVPVDEIDAVIDTNIKGTTNMLRHFIPVMIENKHGIIVTCHLDGEDLPLHRFVSRRTQVKSSLDNNQKIHISFTFCTLPLFLYLHHDGFLVLEPVKCPFYVINSHFESMWT